ncbi:MAG: devR [Frankiales bacterium]|nr:devR [Frankiales bacterium]
MTDVIRVFIVDDHPVVVAGLMSMLAEPADIEVVGNASNGEDALVALAMTPADVVLLDHRLGSGMDGVELCERLTQPPYLLRCLALSAGADGPTLRAFIAAAASGFLLKHADPERIVDAVRSVAGGSLFVDPRLTPLLMDEVGGNAARVASLTARERGVLRLMAAGLSNPQIATQLCVSTSSVKAYVSSVLRKLEARHRAEAVAIAAREGLLDIVGAAGTAHE